MSRILEFRTSWPYVRSVERAEVIIPEPQVKISRPWVIVVETGQIGYVDHFKVDGRVGIRLVDPETGKDLPIPYDQAPHWTQEQRDLVPHELSLVRGQYRAAVASELPKQAEGYMP